MQYIKKENYKILPKDIGNQWKGVSWSLTIRVKVIKSSTDGKLIYKVNVSLIKIPKWLFHGILKLALILFWDIEEYSSHFWKKERYFANIKMYYKTVVIVTP